MEGLAPGGIVQTLQGSTKDTTVMYSPHTGFSASSQILAYPRRRHRSVYCLTEMIAHSWTRLRLSSVAWNIKEDLTLSWRTSNKPSERCAKP